MTVRHGGFVRDADEFDAGFFGISGAEAARMEPQQRLLLQTVWQALEDAGQKPEELRESNTAVFLGATNSNSYGALKVYTEGLDRLTGYDATADSLSVHSGRIASFFGLRGPCLSVDTACSASLVGVHLARQSILTGECDAAIVAGVNLMVFPFLHIAFAKAGLLSPTGRCRAFDVAADGYVRSEGCVAVLLRRESAAVARGDRILASIVGTAVNHHGRSVAMTAPDGPSQERVMRAALAQAGADPSQIGYLDAHGTGTPVGDPVEMGSIAEVYGEARQPTGRPLHVGSVKTNFGHLEAGAGLLGLVKAALSLRHETIFPSVHFERLNPKIDLRGADIRIPTAPVAWPRSAEPRLAGVNSFGYSGTNAAAILREAPAPQALPPTETRQHELLVLSAASREGLAELAGRWAGFLTAGGPTVLADAAYTAAVGRAVLPHRLAVVGEGVMGVVDDLDFWRTRSNTFSVVSGRARGGARIALAFTGEGAGYPGMGRQLYEHEPVFAAAIDRCAERIDPELGTPLRDVLFDERPAGPAEDAGVGQPALFAIQYALTELLRDWGVEPAVVIGHGAGEIAAACASGLLAFDDAARLSVRRGRLLGALSGRMLAVDAGVDAVRAWLAGRADIAIAAVDGPRRVVVSGSADAVAAVARLAEADETATTPLPVPHPLHSPLVEPIRTELEAFAAAFRPGRPAIPMVSTVTGTTMTGAEGPRYWARQARETVRFQDAMGAVLASRCAAIVEVGPHPALAPAVADARGEDTEIRLIPTLDRDRADIRNLLRAAGSLFVTGATLDPARVFAGPRRRIDIPLYPFRRDRYWIAAGGPASVLVPRRAVEPAPSTRHGHGHGMTLTTTMPWTDHRILDRTVFPASGYLELVARAVNGDGPGPVVLRETTFVQPLVLTPGRQVGIRVTVDGASFAIHADDDPAIGYCRGTVEAGNAPVIAGDRMRRDDLRAGLPTGLAAGPFYGRLRQEGIEYGASFATVRELWTGEPGNGAALGRITPVPDGAPPADHAFRLSTTLDGCLQVVAAAFEALCTPEPAEAHLPVRLGRLTLAGPLPAQVWSHARVRRTGGGSLLATVRVADDDGTLIAELTDLELRPAAALAGGGPARATTATRRAGGSRMELQARLDPLPRDRRLAVVTEWIVDEVRHTLGRLAAEYEPELDAGRLDPSAMLLEIGLDSLMVTEFQRHIQEKLDFRFAAMESVEYQSIVDLAEYLLDRVLAPGRP